MHLQLEERYRSMGELMQLGSLYRECGLKQQCLKTAQRITDLTTEIHTMEKQLEQHLHRLQVPDLLASLSIDADDALVLSYELARANQRLIEWFNTQLSNSQKLLLSQYMGMSKGGVQ